MQQQEKSNVLKFAPERILIMIPAEELEELKKGQQLILDQLNRRNSAKSEEKSLAPSHISAKQFMDAVDIRRWKFNQLIAQNKIRTIKKKRKIYVLRTEIERYFSDPSIQ